MKNYKLICVLFCALCIVFSCAKKKEEYGDAESAESTVITYPSVDRTSPSNAQTSVSVSSPIKVTFTKEMDPDSITSNDSDAGYVCTGINRLCFNKVQRNSPCIFKLKGLENQPPVLTEDFVNLVLQNKFTGLNFVHIN